MENKDKKTEFEDVYSDSKKKPTYKKGHKPLSEREVYYPTKFSRFLLENNKRNTKIILASLIVLVLGLVVLFGFVIFNEKFDLMLTPEEGHTGNLDYTENEKEYAENQHDAIHEPGDQASIDGILKQWYNLGGVMDQDYVTNVLLLGVDGTNGVKNGGNTDSMILVSINDKTKTITLVSFMRDSRTYYNVNGREYYAKMNSAFARGGPDAIVKVIENNYKVDIDCYVAVDFSLFSDLVDSLGGVTVDIKEYEQQYINRTTTKIKKIPNYGKVTLDGDQALVYCRIRKCDADGDVSRTRRQRSFITALIQSAKGASLAQLNDAVDAALPHVLTNCTKDAAIANGWMNYEIVQLTMPDEGTRKDVYFPEKVGEQNYNIFYWVVDYPVAAQKVQQTLYGTTNINLGDDRNSVFDYVQIIKQPESDTETTTDANGNGESVTGEDSSGTSETTTAFWEGWFSDDDETTTSNPDEEVTSPPEESTTVPNEEEYTEPAA